MKTIINLDDIEMQPWPPGFAPTDDAAERYDARIGAISRRIGARKLGYNITAVAPGKRAFPFHNHQVNEEMFFILEGHGEIRIGKETFPVRSGDFIACPPGGIDTAHQLVNTGTTELRYLAVSTNVSPELCEYPDTNSGKFTLSADIVDADGKPARFRHVGRPESMADYWEGE